MPILLCSRGCMSYRKALSSAPRKPVNLAFSREQTAGLAARWFRSLARSARNTPKATSTRWSCRAMSSWRVPIRSSERRREATPPRGAVISKALPAQNRMPFVRSFISPSPPPRRGQPPSGESHGRSASLHAWSIPRKSDPFPDQPRLLSRLRYWMASATWRGRIRSSPARSAMVRETLRTRM